MTETAKKALVVAAGLALFGPVVAWRVQSVFSDERYLLAGEELACTAADFSGVCPAPAALPPSNVHRYLTLPPVPSLPLGEFRVQGSLRLLRRTDEDPLLQFGCVKEPLRRLGANAWVVDEVRSLGGWDHGELRGRAFLLHSPQRGLPAGQGDSCVVSSVVGGSPAEEAGVRAGDTLVRWRDFPSVDGVACERLFSVVEGVPVETMALVLLRDGGERVVPLPRGRLQRANTGMSVRSLPVLQAD